MSTQFSHFCRFSSYFTMSSLNSRQTWGCKWRKYEKKLGWKMKYTPKISSNFQNWKLWIMHTRLKLLRRHLRNILSPSKCSRQFQVFWGVGFAGKEMKFQFVRGSRKKRLRALCSISDQENFSSHEYEVPILYALLFCESMNVSDYVLVDVQWGATLPCIYRESATRRSHACGAVMPLKGTL